MVQTEAQQIPTVAKRGFRGYSKRLLKFSLKKMFDENNSHLLCEEFKWLNVLIMELTSLN